MFVLLVFCLNVSWVVLCAPTTWTWTIPECFQLVTTRYNSYLAMNNPRMFPDWCTVHNMAMNHSSMWPYSTLFSNHLAMISPESGWLPLHRPPDHQQSLNVITWLIHRTPTTWLWTILECLRRLLHSRPDKMTTNHRWLVFLLAVSHPSELQG